MGINIYPHKRVTKHQVRLKKIRIRLISDEERDRWNDIVSQFHYLGHANLDDRLRDYRTTRHKLRKESGRRDYGTEC